MTEQEDKNEKSDNPFEGLGVKSIDEYDGRLSIAEYFDRLLNTDEGKALLEKKDTLSQLEFQIELLAIVKKYPRDSI